MSDRCARCIRCGHPRDEGPLFSGRFAYGNWAPHIDPRPLCALCYEERCIVSGRRFLVVLCLALAVVPPWYGDWLAVPFAALALVVLRWHSGLFLRSVRERIAERGPPPRAAPSDPS